MYYTVGSSLTDPKNSNKFMFVYQVHKQNKEKTMGFLIVFVKESKFYRKGAVATLRIKKDYDTWRYDQVRKAFEALREFGEVADYQVWKLLVSSIKDLTERAKEINRISYTLHGPGHGCLSGEHTEKLMDRLNQLLGK